MRKIILIFFLVISVVCISSNAFANSSVIIQNVEKRKVIDKIVNTFIADNWNVINASDYQILLSKNIDSITGKLLFGTNFNRTPEQRLRFNIAKSGNDVIISLDSRIVSNPDSGFEKSIQYNGEELQTYLDNIKKSLNGFYGYGFSAIKKGKYFLVLKIVSGSSAEKSGLAVGDKIRMINNISVKSLSLKDFYDYLRTNKEGTEIILKIDNLYTKSLKEVQMNSIYFPPDNN